MLQAQVGALEVKHKILHLEMTELTEKPATMQNRCTTESANTRML